MKKFNKIATVVLAVASLSLSVMASGFDAFSNMRTIVVDAPRLISGGAAGIVTNSWTDIHGFEGIAKLDISCKTNDPGSILTVLVQTSTDQTNFTTLGSAAYAVATSVSYTNFMYGSTNLYATDTINFPGTVTTPTAATYGWATSYIVPSPFTNTVSALSLPGNVIKTIGFNAADTARYIRLIYTSSGTTTNCSVSAVLTGLNQISP